MLLDFICDTNVLLIISHMVDLGCGGTRCLSMDVLNRFSRSETTLAGAVVAGVGLLCQMGGLLRRRGDGCSSASAVDNEAPVVQAQRCPLGGVAPGVVVWLLV